MAGDLGLMQFKVLGPVEVVAAGRAFTMPRPRSRAVLACLLLSANKLVTTDSIVDAIWGEDPPATARNQIQADVSAIRKSLREAGCRDCIQTTSTGYQIKVKKEELDLAAFQDHLLNARALSKADDLAAAVRHIRQALELWRGTPVGDVIGHFADNARASLGEQRLDAVEQLAELELKLGRHREIVAELDTLARENPLREGIVRQLAVALHRSGRSSEALAALRALKQGLADEFGVDVAAPTAELEVAILRGDPGLDAAPDPEPTAPSTLPAAASAFTGREAQLARLDALHTAGPPALATITGSGGIGKTALALHWAHRNAQHFPDGLLYVDLRGFSSEPQLTTMEALSRLLYQLGVPPAQIPAREDFATDMFRANVASKRLLLLLDNARDSDQARRLLPGGQTCRTLVTSRTELTGLVARDGAQPIGLDVLEPAEAHQLLATVLGAQDTSDLQELAQLCAYVPLALRIAAAGLVSHPQRRVRDYVVRMRSADRLRALELEGDDYTAMSTTFQLSYEVLDPLARKLFRLLSLIPGPDFTLPAAADLAELTVGQAQPLLAALTGAHLIEERTPGRYGFHDLLRLYAANRAAAEDDAEARAGALVRLQTHYLSHVDAAARQLYPQVLRLPMPPEAAPGPCFESTATAIAWLDDERVNLVAAVAAGSEQPSRHLAWCLADALRGYFFLRMFTVDWHTTAHAALMSAQAAGDDQAQAVALLSLADLHWRQGDYDLADSTYARTTQHAEAAGWLAGKAVAVGNLGGLRRMQGRLREAAELINESLTLNVKADRIEGQSVNLGNLGIVYGELGDWARSEQILVRGLDVFRQIGSRTGQAIALSNLGEVTLNLGNVDLAEERVRLALTLHHELGDKAGEASTLRSLADVHLARGKAGRALEIAQTAVALAEESADERVLAHCLKGLAAIMHVNGDDEGALAAGLRSVELANAASHRYVQTRALIGLAEIHLSLGQSQEGLDRARQALALAESCGYLGLAEEAGVIITGVREGSRP